MNFAGYQPRSGEGPGRKILSVRHNGAVLGGLIVCCSADTNHIRRRVVATLMPLSCVSRRLGWRAPKTDQIQRKTHTYTASVCLLIWAERTTCIQIFAEKYEGGSCSSISVGNCRVGRRLSEVIRSMATLPFGLLVLVIVILCTWLLAAPKKGEKHFSRENPKPDSYGLGL